MKDGAPPLSLGKARTFQMQETVKITSSFRADTVLLRPRRMINLLYLLIF